jgi:hypothetical protein
MEIVVEVDPAKVVKILHRLAEEQAAKGFGKKVKIKGFTDGEVRYLGVTRCAGSDLSYSVDGFERFEVRMPVKR